jgi:hypothetical protein
MLRPTLNEMIFGQEYQRKQDRVSVKQMPEVLERFFEAVPRDIRYHIDLRTEAYLRPQVFAVLEKHGVGQEVCRNLNKQGPLIPMCFGSKPRSGSEHGDHGSGRRTRIREWQTESMAIRLGCIR